MSYFTSKTLLAAKSLAKKDWTYPSVILAARHMANSGSTLDEIKEFLGWNVGRETVRRRLKQYRIMPFSKEANSHRGQDTGLGGAKGIYQADFSAKMVITKKVIQTFECVDCHKIIPRKRWSRGVKCQKCKNREMAFRRANKYLAKKAKLSP